MLATEGFVVSAIGLAVGLMLGFAVSLILIRVVNRQSFHWGMDLSLPWDALAGFAGALLALSTVTALASGRHAMGEGAVSAVKEDW
jgi:putative ABC transport system permease protein